MRKFIFCSCIMMQFCSVVSAQDQRSKAFGEAFGLIGNWKTNKEYIKIFNRFSEDTLLSDPSSPVYQHYLFLKTVVGLHKEAIKDFNILSDTIKGNNTFQPQKYRVKPIIYSLIPVISDKRVIMTNEEHFMPRHRILPMSLLPFLYKQGFRYFAFEALNEEDSMINQRGYGVMRSGYYTDDPVFGELIREAIALGYTLIPYEEIYDAKKQSKDPIVNQQRREDAQAGNLVTNVLRKDPSAKILVHAGRGHIAKGVSQFSFNPNDAKKELRFMAEMFKIKSGIDPYTIDQTNLEEHSDVVFDRFPNRWIATQPGYANTTLGLISKDSGKIYTSENGIYDCLALSTKTTYTNNRPGWLINLPGRKLYDVDVTRFQPVKGYYMVQAVYAKEDTLLAVPADQFAYQRGNKKVSLVLKKGSRYLIRVLNAEGEVLKEWFKNM
jgi:hypothetical protein